MKIFCSKPIHCSSGCMLRLIVLLEGEPPPQSLQNRFSSKIVLYLAPSIFPSTQTSFPVPAEEKHPHSMMLPPPCFTVGMVCSGWCAVFSATCSILHLGQKLQFWSHLTRAPCSTFVCCAPHMACGISSCHSSIKAHSVEFITNSCPVGRLSHLSCGSLQLCQSYHGPLGRFSDQWSPCPACQFRW